MYSLHISLSLSIWSMSRTWKWLLQTAQNGSVPHQDISSNSHRKIRTNKTKMTMTRIKVRKVFSKQFLFITARQRSCEKVMFLHVSVILSAGACVDGGACIAKGRVWLRGCASLVGAWVAGRGVRGWALPPPAPTATTKAGGTHLI